ncbi:putative MFS family arabinose efflux permease [Actinomadura pelletieri DSM 43383]|uniref:Putative MFS family arabinose efflux permease n=1 Tax=Actinomadura pelletieri DSM 43383 TaxID=1120940 RepID=A0A495QLV1_9ACTN|nr:MFS transporter [Actinomadura pelletieri]RKS73552.1 putative MFS family arabinose efflux permease [Actinomadura pelletieri DSM 43383]
MTDTVPAWAEDLPHRQVQRRVLIVLVAAQVLSGAGLAAGVTVGALLAQEMLGSTGLAGLPSALGTAGSALAALAVGRVSQARGRRPGLAAGYLAGAVGSAGVIVAAVADDAVLLFLSLFVYGAGAATNLQARYAGADLASPARRASAVSTVLVATTVGGVVGPSLTAPTGDLAHALGIPYLAGPFLLAGTVYVLAALILVVWLRPDPLLLAGALEAERVAAARALPGKAADPPRPAVEGHRSRMLVGALVMVLTQLVMVAIMTMTPVHMRDHGHGAGASGFVIAVHIGAMYLPSPLTGRLVDRYGRLTIAAASGLTLLAAGIVAANAPGGSVAALVVALALLGLGWNFGVISGTAIVTDAVPLATRAKTQGLVDVAIAISGATGGMASGLVVAAAGYPLLAIGGGILALAIVPATVVTARVR